MHDDFDDAEESACDPEIKAKLRPSFASLRRTIERDVAALEKSRPRRRSTALRVLSAQARRAAGLIGALAWLDRIKADTPPEPKKSGDRARAELKRRINAIVAAEEREKAREAARLESAIPRRSVP